MTTFIQTGQELVGDLLSRQIHYRVPVHQPDYAWSEDEVSQFWDDILHAMHDGSEHFLGPVVVRQVTEDNSYEIIDGQQRFTTALMLLAATRNTYHENGDNLAQTLQATYFGHINRRTRATDAKFTMNSLNDATFQEFIVDIKPTRKFEERIRYRRTRLSNRRLLQAYLYLKGKIDDITSADGNFNSEPLADLEDFLKQKLSVIQIIVSDEADAYTLFETLNERGIELSVLDLLKNHLFKKAGTSVEVVKQRWHETLANLDENIGTKFIRHYWISKNGRVQAGRLYRALRDSARTKANVMKLSEDLLESSNLYDALSVADHGYWDDYDASVRNDIAVLKLLNAVQCLPVLMAAHNKFDKENFTKTIHLMVVMAVRYSLICSYRTGALEIHYAEVARDISNGKLKRAAAVRRALADLYPSDQSFRDAFAEREIRSSKHARFLLRELEVQKRGGILGPVDDPASLNLEHIIPKVRNQHWRNLGDLRGEPYEYWVNRLGNQVLLSKEQNAKLGGSPIQEKKPILEKSELMLTNEVARFASWGVQEVADRQRGLAELAVHRWRYEI